MGLFDVIVSAANNIAKTVKEKVDDAVRVVEHATGVDIPFFGDTYVNVKKAPTKPSIPIPKNPTPKQAVEVGNVAAAIGVMARKDYGTKKKVGNTVVVEKPVPKVVQNYIRKTTGSSYTPSKIIETYKTTPTGKQILVESKTIATPEKPVEKKRVELPAYIDQTQKAVYLPNAPKNAPNTVTVKVYDQSGKVVGVEKYKVIKAAPPNNNLQKTTLTGYEITTYGPRVYTTTYDENKEYYAFRRAIEERMMKKDIGVGIANALLGLIDWNDFLNVKSTYYALTGQREKYIDTVVNKMWRFYRNAPKTKEGKLAPLTSGKAVEYVVTKGVTSPTALLSAAGEVIGYGAVRGAAVIGSRFGPTAGSMVLKGAGLLGAGVTALSVGEPLSRGDVGEALNRGAQAIYTVGFAVHGGQSALKSVLPEPNKIYSMHHEHVETLGGKNIVQGRGVAKTDTGVKAVYEYVGDIDTYTVNNGQVSGRFLLNNKPVEYTIVGRPVQVATGDVAYSGKVYTPLGEAYISNETPIAQQSYTVAQKGGKAIGFSKTVQRGLTSSSMWFQLGGKGKTLTATIGSAESGKPILYNLTLTELKTPAAEGSGGSGSGGVVVSTGGGTAAAQATKTTTTTPMTMEAMKQVTDLMHKGIESITSSVTKTITGSGTVGLLLQKGGTKSNTQTKTKTKTGLVSKTLTLTTTTVKPSEVVVPTVEPPQITPKPHVRHRPRRKQDTVTVTVPKVMELLEEKQKQDETTETTPTTTTILDILGKTKTDTTETTTVVTSSLASQLLKPRIETTQNLTTRMLLFGSIFRLRRVASDIMGAASGGRKYPLWGFRRGWKETRIGLLADWISVNISAVKYGRATHPLPTPKILSIAKRTLFQKVPTVELFTRKKKRIKRRKKK